MEKVINRTPVQEAKYLRNEQIIKAFRKMEGSITIATEKISKDVGLSVPQVRLILCKAGLIGKGKRK